MRLPDCAANKFSFFFFFTRRVSPELRGPPSLLVPLELHLLSISTFPNTYVTRYPFFSFSLFRPPGGFLPGWRNFRTQLGVRDGGGPPQSVPKHTWWVLIPTFASASRRVPVPGQQRHHFSFFDMTVTKLRSLTLRPFLRGERDDVAVSPSLRIYGVGTQTLSCKTGRHSMLADTSRLFPSQSALAQQEAEWSLYSGTLFVRAQQSAEEQLPRRLLRTEATKKKTTLTQTSLKVTAYNARCEQH